MQEGCGLGHGSWECEHYVQQAYTFQSAGDRQIDGRGMPGGQLSYQEDAGFVIPSFENTTRPWL